MNKIKKVWEENKVLMVLAIILAVCLLIVGIVAITYFYGSSDSVYGNRLDTIKDIPLNDKLLNEIKSELEKNEKVTKVENILKGKILYVSINYSDDTTLEDAKKIAETIIPLFNEDELDHYDIEFTIANKEFTLMGARNKNGSGMVVWNNYNIPEDSDE